MKAFSEGGSSVPCGTTGQLHTLTLPGQPDPPTGKVSQTRSATAELTWDHPSDDGGAPITGAIVEYRKGKTQIWKRLYDAETEAMVIRVPDLEKSVEYFFRIIASNEVGGGLPSNASKQLIYGK